MAQPAGEHDSQLGREFRAEFAILLGLGGLSLQDGDLAGHLVEDVVDARKIGLRGFKSELGEPLLRLEARDARSFLDDGAPVQRLGAE